MSVTVTKCAGMAEETYSEQERAEAREILARVAARKAAGHSAVRLPDNRPVGIGEIAKAVRTHPDVLASQEPAPPLTGTAAVRRCIQQGMRKASEIADAADAPETTVYAELRAWRKLTGEARPPRQLGVIGKIKSCLLEGVTDIAMIQRVSGAKTVASVYLLRKEFAAGEAAWCKRTKEEGNGNAPV